MKFLSPSSTMIMEQPSVRPKTILRGRSKTISGTGAERDAKRLHTYTIDKRRGSVDSVFAGLNKPFLSCHRDKLSDVPEKKRNEKGTSQTISTKKEKSKRDPTVSSKDVKQSPYGADLKPILKSCSRTNGVYLSMPIENEKSSSPDRGPEKLSVSPENKFSYRLPTTTKMPVRKSVSFREESEESEGTNDDAGYRSRRFSSPSLGFFADLTISQEPRKS